MAEVFGRLDDGWRTDFGSGYPDPPPGVGIKKWLTACDSIAQNAWTKGVAPDWDDAKKLLV